jgi:hypothetical protein
MDSDSEKENEDAPEFPEVTEDVPVKWMESRKGKQLLVDPYNYVYENMKTVKNTTYWRCQRSRSKLFPRYFVV